MSVIMVYNRYITWLNPNLKFGIQEFSGSCIRPVRAPVKGVAGKAGRLCAIDSQAKWEE